MELLEGKKGLVIGVANERSYAWHIAKSLLDAGAHCAFSCLPGDKAEARAHLAVEALEVEIEDPWIKPCDASKDEDLTALFQAYEKDHDRLDFLIHSIAFANREWLQPGSFVETPRDDFLLALDISVYTLVGMAKRARPMMAESGGGSIVAMSYYGAEKVVSGYNVMGVSKAALECSVRYLASDLGEDGIRVNSISGGALKTLAASAIKGFRGILSHNEKRAPLKRNTTGGDVGGTAAWLVSDLASGVTGENIYVECGVNTIGL
jgi:enoyl-[acyl-carrier protein] reductase I